MDARTLARLGAIQALYEAEASGDFGAALLVLCADSGAKAKEMALFNNLNRINKKIFEAIIQNVSRETISIDTRIKDNLAADWSFERIGGVLRATLRAALGESLGENPTPKSVLISEYVGITSGFYDDKEVKFVNAILDKIL
jgi:N utilization substance protein B